MIEALPSLDEINNENYEAIGEDCVEIRKKILSKERITEDIDYYRFKALEGLKLLKKVAIVNDRYKYHKHFL